MTLRELYPYWGDAHEEMIERLEILTDVQWDSKPCHSTAGSIRQIALGLIRHELFWIEGIAQGRGVEVIPAAELNTPDNIVSELRATREATLRYLGTLQPESMRAVRTAPADPAANEIERNVPLTWIFWHVLEYELACWGQIQMRMAD